MAIFKYVCLENVKENVKKNASIPRQKNRHAINTLFWA